MMSPDTGKDKERDVITFENIYPFLIQKFLGIDQNIVAPMIKGTVSVYNETDSYLNKISHAFSCHKGCYYCCSLNVDSSMHENIMILTNLLLLGNNKLKFLIDQISKWGYTFGKLIFANNLCDFINDKEKYSTMIRLYKEQKIQCPFLMYNECAIYQTRPVVCRTYSSCSDPQLCKEGKPREIIIEIDRLKDDMIEKLISLDKKFFNKPVYQPLGYYFFSNLSNIEMIRFSIKKYSQTGTIK